MAVDLDNIPLYSNEVSSGFATSNTDLETAIDAVNSHLSDSIKKMQSIKYSISVSGLTPSTITHHFVVFEHD